MGFVVFLIITLLAVFFVERYIAKKVTGGVSEGKMEQDTEDKIEHNKFTKEEMEDLVIALYDIDTDTVLADRIKSIVDNGFDLTYRDSKGYTLISALYWGKFNTRNPENVINLTEYLISKGANLTDSKYVTETFLEAVFADTYVTPETVDEYFKGSTADELEIIEGTIKLLEYLKRKNVRFRKAA